eukprot:6895623-Alexandrium_andersonii.AAC.1
MKTDEKVVKDRPTEREQHTRGGMITGTLCYTVQQNELEPRRELLRNKTGDSEKRKTVLADQFMDRARESWEFR